MTREPGAGGATPAEDAAPEVEFSPTTAAPPEILDLGQLVLRRWSLDDLDPHSVVVARSVAHLTPFMGWAAEHDRTASEEYLERCIRQWQAREAYGFAMLDPADHAIVGSVALLARIGPGALEIGYWVAADRVGNGFATLAAAGLTDAGLAIADIDRIEIHHDLANEISGRVPARLGFTRVREHPVPKSAPSESGINAVWAMVGEDWPSSPGRGLLSRAG